LGLAKPEPIRGQNGIPFGTHMGPHLRSHLGPILGPGLAPLDTFAKLLEAFIFTQTVALAPTTVHISAGDGMDEDEPPALKQTTSNVAPGGLLTKAQTLLGAVATDGDQGLGSIMMCADANTKDKQVYLEQMTGKLVLNYVGAVTTVAAVGALPLCTAFGLDWYVNGSAYMANDKLIPSWLIPETGMWKKSTGKKLVAHYELAVVESISKPFVFAYNHGAKKLKISVDIKIYSLRCDYVMFRGFVPD
jgi:hypothetical protein